MTLLVLGEGSVALDPRFAETSQLLLSWLPKAEGFVLSPTRHSSCISRTRTPWPKHSLISTRVTHSATPWRRDAAAGDNTSRSWQLRRRRPSGSFRNAGAAVHALASRAAGRTERVDVMLARALKPPQQPGFQDTKPGLSRDFRHGRTWDRPNALPSRAPRLSCVFVVRAGTSRSRVAGHDLLSATLDD